MLPIRISSIGFDLIYAPAALFPAAERDGLKSRLHRARDLSPVNYKRVAEADGKEVCRDQIVKGCEHEKGKFVVLKDDDFKRVDVEASQTVEIMDLVMLSEINPMYFYKPYHVKPGKGYASLRETLLRDKSWMRPRRQLLPRRRMYYA